MFKWKVQALWNICPHGEGLLQEESQRGWNIKWSGGKFSGNDEAEVVMILMGAVVMIVLMQIHGG